VKYRFSIDMASLKAE